MSKITNGTVKFCRMVRPADFENKTCEVTLSFTVDDGEDHSAVVTSALSEAHAKVHAMLGIKTTPKIEAAVVEPKTETKPEPTAETKPKGPTKADLEKAALAKLEGKTETKPELAKTAAEDFSEFDEDAAESQPEITDAMLSAAMNAKVGKLKEKHAGAAPKLVKELINKFVEPPKKSHDIPQNLRAEFLKKLEALE